MGRHGALPWRLAVIASLLAVVAFGEEAAAEADAEKELAATEDNITQVYRPPNTEGLHWVETFDGDAMSRWVNSAKEKYNGKFNVEKRRKEGLIGDVALLVTEPAKTYGISTSMPALKGAKEVPFIIQFEVQFQDGLQCGGSYVKLFDRKGAKAEDFADDTPYVIMFGPDRCGGTDKVHFILQHQNPKTLKWEEKHLTETPRAPNDMLSHTYGLVINPDNTFEVQIDGEKKASGDLLKSLSPPINPPKDIDDPADSKPSDWMDEAKMDDPESSKPEDWDEEEPHSVPDPAATMPTGWREDVKAGKVADPSAQIPGDWDEEEDGEWEAPTIDNPDCTVGCGKWNPPTITNPKYKGKWNAPKIDNPAYKGVWGPKQIANPDFFEDKTPCILPQIDSIGIDIWTMQGGILFDNFVIATDAKKVESFTEKTFKIRRNIEELQQPKPSSSNSIMDTLTAYWIPIAVTAALLLMATIWCCLIRGDAEPPARPVPKKKRRDESPKPSEEKDPGEESEEKEEEKKEDKKDD